MKTYEAQDEEGTKALAEKLAATLCAGDVILLQGALGAGKTAFARALINALSDAPQEVPSPTFTLVQTYDTAKGLVWHFDLYRLSDAEEVIELGWEEARSDGIILVEWPDRLGPFTPKDYLSLHIDFIDKNLSGRLFEVTPQGDWENRINSVFI